MNDRRRARVLMLIPQLGYGGAESAFLRLADYLARHADVTIALFERSYGSEDYSSEGGTTALPVVMLDGEHARPRGSIGKLFRWWRMFRRLRKIKRDYNVAISFLSGANLLNSFAGPKYKTIVSERGSKKYHLGISERTRFLWLRILDPLIYRRARWIVPASIGYAEEIFEIGGRKIEQRVVPIEGGIDAGSLLAQSEDQVEEEIARFCANHRVAVYCGRLAKGKGIDLLLPAFAAISSQSPQNRLLVIGDGPLLNTLISECARLGLITTRSGDPRAAVFFAGYRTQPVRLIRLGSVFLFPSLHEGLGNALIEAVASGAPVLASDCRWGPRSVLAGPMDKPPDQMPVTESVCFAYGTLMPLPDQTGAQGIWAREIAKALALPRKRASLEDRSVAVERFDIERTGPQWLKLVKEIGSQRSL